MSQLDIHCNNLLSQNIYSQNLYLNDLQITKEEYLDLSSNISQVIYDDTNKVTTIASNLGVSDSLATFNDINAVNISGHTLTIDRIRVNNSLLITDDTSKITIDNIENTINGSVKISSKFI